MLKLTKNQIANKTQNIGIIMGMLSAAKANGKKKVLLDIPVELLAIDDSYQIEERTKRSMNYLLKNWDERWLLPLIVVPRYKDGVFAIADGYARVVVAPMVDKEKYKTLLCMVMLDAPEGDEEQLKYEAEIFALQNKCVSQLKPYDKHGAMMVLKDKATLELDKAMQKYGYKYPTRIGRRAVGMIGSYTSCLKTTQKGGFDALDYVFAIAKASAFDRQWFGLSSYVVKGLADMYFLYGNKYRRTEKYFGGLLRATTPVLLIANARTAYPYQDTKMAVSLYLEDKLTGASGVNRRRYEDPTTRKVIILDNANVAGQSA